MSKHKSGDMVRVNCPISTSHGVECVVIRVSAEGEHLGETFIGCEVSIPCDTHDTAKWCIFEDDELIPISRLTVDELADARETA